MTDVDNDPNSDLETVWKLISKIDFCMMVTNDDFRFKGRPMSSIARRELNQIAFLSEARSPQVGSLQNSPNLLLSYSDGRSFVCLYGTALIDHDRALIKELWNPGAQAFWPEGPEKSDVVAILVTPESAEYWHSSGVIISAVKFLYALGTKTTPDLGDNAKVDM